MYNDIRKNENKGFSLVELIVVIAIMAVMTAVLAPSLLQYVEKSRAQKDDSAMGEVVNVIKLALADQAVYDECLCYTIEDNASAYIQGADETPWDLTAIPDDTAMRGLTITFHPEKDANQTLFDLGTGKVNEYFQDADAYNGAATGDLEMQAMDSGSGIHEMFTKVKAGIPEGKVVLNSQTYRNSDYTVFIQMGNATTAVVVTGGWNGTNIHAGETDVSEAVTSAAAGG